MKRKTMTPVCLSACALAMVTSSASAQLLFQGSSSPSVAVPDSPAAARAAWEAELATFTVDDLNSLGSGPPFTSASTGFVYSESGNGSQISNSGSSIGGDRNGASRIEFTASFPEPVNAAAFDVIDNDGGGMTIELIDAFTGDPYVFNFTSTNGSGHSEFFGVVFPNTVFVSSLTVSGTDPGGITTWDNFSVGVGEEAVNPAEIPEVSSTLTLCGLLLSGLGFRRRK